MDVLIAILAAGASSRMCGGDKSLEEVGGRPLLRMLADRALATGCAVAVTLPPDRPERAAALVGMNATRIFVADAADGMAFSFRAVARAACGRGVLIVLADMPEIETEDLRALLEAGEAMPGRIIRAASEVGELGHPVLFPPEIVPEMEHLSGDKGARRILEGRQVVPCPLPGRRALVDLNTPDAWAAWRTTRR